MDLRFRKPEEVVGLLCERLRKERLYLEMTQADVATRAGIYPTLKDMNDMHLVTADRYYTNPFP